MTAVGNARTPASGVAASPMSPPADDGVVYVVDDDPSVCQALARLLRSVGLSVETFALAQAFLDWPVPDRPACLVLDVRLPGGSGLDLQSALRENGRLLPIVFITGQGDVASSVRAMKGGAVDYLQKPFDDNVLLECVRRAIQAARQQRAEQAARAALERRLARLTPREREVLRLVVRGMLNKQIAADLRIAEKTVKIHRGRAMEKMQAASLADLVRMAEKLRERLTPP